MQRRGGPQTDNRNIFATPLLVGKIADPSIRDGLEEIILARRAEDPGIRRSNIAGGWHSDLQLMQWGGDPARKLLDHVIALVNRNTTAISAPGRGAQNMSWMVEAWANVNENGGANARHVHGGCFWSAVYYVRKDEGTGGELVLFDPRMPTLAMHAPHLRFRNTGGEREVRLKPEAGLLIVFPSWLAHSVEPWHGEGLRISIAINLTAARAAAPKGTLLEQARLAKAPGAPVESEKDDL
jgi:uncharacterized protein (TIGR02466 family)